METAPRNCRFPSLVVAELVLTYFDAQSTPRRGEADSRVRFGRPVPNKSLTLSIVSQALFLTLRLLWFFEVLSLKKDSEVAAYSPDYALQAHTPKIFGGGRFSP